VKELTSNAILLCRVKNSFMINPFLKIGLSLFAQLKILHRNLTNKFEIFFKFVTSFLNPLWLTNSYHGPQRNDREPYFMEVIEFHPRDPRFIGWTDSKAGHSTAVDIQGAVGKKVKKKPVVRFLGICNVLREVGVIVDSVKCGWIENGETCWHRR
jgi:hypothetical protein